MNMSFEGALHLFAGIVMTGLYMSRERGLRRVDQRTGPELDPASFAQLKNLLRTAYQRTMYLAVSFFHLAFVTILNRTVQARWFGLILAVSLFFYNIPPRNKAMRLFTAVGLDWKELDRRGIKL